jgi:outer membrane protein assembly factor BamE (lipoprotein component of BamABCDE complex)
MRLMLKGFSGFLPRLGLALVSCYMAGCAPTYHQHGQIAPCEAVFEGLQKGITPKETVIDLLGAPTVISTFDDQKWYYISRQTKSHTSFSRPTLRKSTVHLLTFQPDGALKSVELLSPDAVRDVTPVTRQTPTKGYDPSIFKQMFKNLGRFDAGAPRR